MENRRIVKASLLLAGVVVMGALAIVVLLIFSSSTWVVATMPAVIGMAGAVVMSWGVRSHEVKMSLGQVLRTMLMSIVGLALGALGGWIVAHILIHVFSGPSWLYPAYIIIGGLFFCLMVMVKEGVFG